MLYRCFASPRTRYILAAEGPTYLLLALLSFLNRLMPVFENSLKAHKILDIIIGACTVGPRVTALTQNPDVANRCCIVFSFTLLHVLSLYLQAEGIFSSSSSALCLCRERLLVGSDTSYHCHQ